MATAQVTAMPSIHAESVELISRAPPALAAISCCSASREKSCDSSMDLLSSRVSARPRTSPSYQVDSAREQLVSKRGIPKSGKTLELGTLRPTVLRPMLNGGGNDDKSESSGHVGGASSSSPEVRGSTSHFATELNLNL